MLSLCESRQPGHFIAKLYGSARNFPKTVEVIKSMPSRQYSIKERGWVLPIADLDLLVSYLDAQTYQELDGLRKMTRPLYIKWGQYKAWIQKILEAKDRNDCDFSVPGLNPKYQMRPYQKVGADFLTRRNTVLMADDMGLGKSLQAIAAAVKLFVEGKARSAWIVCPASMKSVWAGECVAEFFPSISYTIIDGSLKKRPETECKIITLRQSGHVYNIHTKTCRKCPVKEQCQVERKAVKGVDVRAAQWREPSFVKIVNYEILRIDSRWLLENRESLNFPDVYILDEGHRIRNGKTHQRKKFDGEKWADIPLTNTGAVLETAKWSKWRWMLTGTPLQNQLEDLFHCMKFVHPGIFPHLTGFRERYMKTDYFGKVCGYEHLNEINYKLAPNMIRRHKKDVEKDLPEKISHTVKVELSSQQRSFYNDVRDQILASRDEIIANKIKWAQVLASITYCREAADSTELVDKTAKPVSTKIQELWEILGEVISEHKVVIFSCFERMVNILHDILPYKSVVISGSVRNDKRTEAIRQFREDEETRLMLLTSAGGEGINLQVADIVIIFDLPWNPAVVAQVQDRLHRIGQTKTVNVIHLIAENTIEERMWEVCRFKQSLFDATVEGIDVEKMDKRQVLDML